MWYMLESLATLAVSKKSFPKRWIWCQEPKSRDSAQIAKMDTFGRIPTEYFQHIGKLNRKLGILYSLYFYIDTYWYFGDSYRYFFLFKWILGPLQNTYFYVKLIVGFLKNANYFAVWEKCREFLHIFSFFFRSNSTY